MAFIRIPFTAEVELVYSQYGQTMENTLYVFTEEGWTTENLTTLADAFASWWEVSMRSLTVTGAALEFIRATDMNSATGAQITYSEGLPMSGSNEDTGLPGNVTLAVTFRTDTRGRSYRGRNYIIGIGDASRTGNIANSGFVSSLIAAYGVLRTDLTGLGMTWVVASRYSGVSLVTGRPIPRSTGVTTPVTGVTCDGVLDSQRRRLTGRGS